MPVFWSKSPCCAVAACGVNHVKPQLMRPNLVPAGALTQVVFGHDYIQLVFSDVGFSFYNPVRLISGGVAVAKGAAGFADTLVSLIGRKVISAQGSGALNLIFDNALELQIDAAGDGPEAFQFKGADGSIVVEQNV